MIQVFGYFFHTGKCRWINKNGKRVSAKTNHYLFNKYILGLK